MLYSVRREARDALLGEALSELLEIDDIFLAVQNDDLLAARTQCIQYVPLARLLDDLGWDPQDERQQFELTLPEAQLADAVRSLHRTALHRVRLYLANGVEPGNHADANQCAMTLEACAALHGLLVFALRATIESDGVPAPPPPRRQTVPREARDALREAVLSDLRHLPALSEAIETHRFRTARALGARYVAELALLDDLGWDAEDDREVFELSLPDDQLARASLRLINHLTMRALDVPPRHGEHDPEWIAATSRLRRVHETCGDLLQQLPPDIVAQVGEPLPDGWPR